MASRLNITRSLHNQRRYFKDMAIKDILTKLLTGSDEQ